MPSPIPAPLTDGYFQVTQANLLVALSERLDDPNNIYWSAAELRIYIAEALRTWQAYTGWYRMRVVLNAAANTQWYDLTASLTPPLLKYTATDQGLLSSVLYHLLEPQIASSAYVGTDQFDLVTIQASLQNRVNRFLGDTGAVINYVLQQGGIIPSATRALLPSTTIDVRRVAWVDSTSGSTIVLWKESDWSINAFLHSTANEPGSPLVYAEGGMPPNSIRLAPPPANDGLLELLLIQSGPTVNVTAPLPSTPVILQIPDDFVWGVKWGVLADLLSRDGQCKDAQRAAYCESRYQECVQLLRTFPSVTGMQIGSQSIFTSSVFDLDAFKPSWENETPSTPTDAGLAGRTLMALSPAPSTNMNLPLDVVRNMPVPVADSDYLQIPSDVVPALIDYVQHLASFKMGGDEFASTQVQRASFLTAAANYNGRLRHMDFFTDATRSLAQTQSAEIPRIETPTLVGYQIAAPAQPTS
jgi:hypothetical protein